jgi:hypothetical protein
VYDGLPVRRLLNVGERTVPQVGENVESGVREITTRSVSKGQTDWEFPRLRFMPKNSLAYASGYDQCQRQVTALGVCRTFRIGVD